MMDDHDHTDSNESSPVVAFAITVGAGAATWIGAAVVFIPVLMKNLSPRLFASALGISAGVLAYISTIGIFGESFANFESSGLSHGRAYTYATICFMAGAVALSIIDILVSITYKLKDKTTKKLSKTTRGQETKATDMEANVARNEGTDIPSDKVIPHCPGCVDDPLSELNEMKRRAELDVLRTSGDDEQKRHDDQTSINSHVEDPHVDGGKKSLEFIRTDDRIKLMRTGMSVGLAITLHNFPEGFATFFAALSDARVGALLAAGIALHNLPLGICVCFPIYYSTGSRWKGFLSGFALGLTQPLAALFGWLIIDKSITDDKLGTLFGFSAGMMLLIALKELLPTAHKYDLKDSVVTYSVLVGMGVMALASALLEGAGGHDH